jgi:hypothetical protein
MEARALTGVDGRDCEPWFSLHFADPLFFIGALVLLAIGAKCRWLSSYEWLVGAALLLIPYLTRAYETGMYSMGRFSAVVVPAYIVTGQMLARLPSGFAIALLAISSAFLLIYSALFSAGYAVF